MASEKIKIVVSDFHISKGRYLKDGSINTFEEFTKDIQFRDFLEFYTRGKFANCEIELIINGDLFNFFYLDYKGVFPFFVNEKIVIHQVQKSIQGHPVFFESLKSFLKDEKHSLTYILGNHDMHMYFEGAQRELEKSLENEIKWRYSTYVFDGIHIEHGHQFEVLNRVDPKRIFLTRGYPLPVLNMPWASMYCLEFLTRMKKNRPSIDKTRPFKYFIKWGLWNDTFATLVFLMKTVAFFLKSKLENSGSRYKYCNFRISLKMVRRLRLYGDLDKHAYNILSRYQSIHTVIMGHTHVAKCRQWHNGKQYFNTGTWTDILSLEVGSLGQRSKNTFALIDYRQGPFPVVSLHQWQGYWSPELDVAL